MAYRAGMSITHIHVFVGGEGHDIPFAEMDIVAFPTEAEIKAGVERHLNLAQGTLASYQADGYEATGQVTLRPDSRLGVGEVDVRLKIMNSLLTCPHRDIDSIVALHKEMMDGDPEFYAHFAVWAQNTTQVRDHKEAFIACLFSSQYPEFREVAYVLMQDLPPYQVERVSRQVQGGWLPLNVRPPKTEGEKIAKGVKAKGAKAPSDPRYTEFQTIKKDLIAAYTANKEASLDAFKARVRTLFKLPKDANVRATFSKVNLKVKDKEGKKTGERKVVVKVHFDYYRPGLRKGAPGIMQTGVKNFLRNLESDERRFDAASVRQYHALKALYGTYHVAPSDTADLILFKDRPPEGSMRAAMKHIAHIDDPVEWAKAVVTAGIPYPVAVGLLPMEMTPIHLIGLINNMSPQELLNSVASLEARGAMDNADVKALIEKKLNKAGSSKRVDALKAQKAVATLGASVSEETRKAVEAVSDKQVRRIGNVKKPTALAIDASFSMTDAIDLGKEIGALLSPICRSTFACFTFNDMATLRDVRSNKKSEWDTALRFVKAIGPSDIGCVVPAVQKHVEKLRQADPSTPLIEQFLLVTDENENRFPGFAARLDEYRKATGVAPNVVIVRIGKEATSTVEKSLRALGFEVDVWTPDVNGGKVDYYSLPNLIPLLAKGSKAELLAEIMEVPLPSRSEWDAKNLPKTQGETSVSA